MQWWTRSRRVWRRRARRRVPWRRALCQRVLCQRVLCQRVLCQRVLCQGPWAVRLAVAIGALGAVLGVLGQCSVWADPPSGVRPRPIPEFQRCPTGEAACPGYGTAGDSGYVDFASVGNPCGGVTTIAITPTSVTLVTAPVRDTCPLFYRIIPDCGRTIGKPGCCITRLEDREVLEQRLRCRCVSSFLLLFCRRFSCEPEGDLHGAGWLYDCADATPCDPEAGADCNERRSASDR